MACAHVGVSTYIRLHKAHSRVHTSCGIRTYDEASRTNAQRALTIEACS